MLLLDGPGEDDTRVHRVRKQTQIMTEAAQAIKNQHAMEDINLVRACLRD